MKNTYKIFLFVIIAQIGLTSCEKEPSAGFEAISTSYTGEKIDFSNTSSDADSYVWDFGDGEESTETNPSHQFNGVGTYTVTLKASNGAGTSQATLTIDVLQGTELDLTVMYDGTTTPLSYSNIRIYDNTTDWQNSTNYIFESTADINGEIYIVGVSSIVYYVDAFLQTTNGFFANWNISNMTDALDYHKINSYNVYVEYISDKKTGYKQSLTIKRLEPANSAIKKGVSVSTNSTKKVIHIAK